MTGKKRFGELHSAVESAIQELDETLTAERDEKQEELDELENQESAKGERLQEEIDRFDEQITLCEEASNAIGQIEF